MKVLVLGAGAMGYAVVKDMLDSSEVLVVGVVDLSTERLDTCRELSTKRGDEPCRVETYVADVSNVDCLVPIMKDFDVVCAALLHKHSPIAIEAAVRAGVSIVDLVGSRIEEKMAWHETAKAKGIAVVPGAGVAPGMSNIFVSRGAQQLDAPETGVIYVGGIPLNPLPPLDYSVVFALETVLNACVEPAKALRDGKMVDLPPLSEVEQIDFPTPPGRCEAFVTEGLATLPFTMQKLGMKNLCEKTVRYPGYVQKVRFLIECGLFDKSPVAVDGTGVVPRQFLAQVLAPRLALGDGKDLIAMRVIVEGKKRGKRARYVAEILDYFDDATGLTSMARTTAFPACIIARAIVNGEISARGFLPVEEAVDDVFFPVLKKRLAVRGVHFSDCLEMME